MSNTSTLGPGLAALLALAPLATIVHPTAQDPAAFVTATGLKCVFPVMSMGNWTKTGDPTNETKPSAFTLVYEAIDTQDGSAQMKGYAGNVHITVRLVGGNLHLLAINSGGPVYLTTVFNSEARKGTFKAAHSRHEFTPVSLPGFTSRPEQYVGECEVVNE